MVEWRLLPFQPEAPGLGIRDARAGALGRKDVYMHPNIPDGLIHELLACAHRSMTCCLPRFGDP
jgi:hypothetical protein